MKGMLRAISLRQTSSVVWSSSLWSDDGGGQVRASLVECVLQRVGDDNLGSRVLEMIGNKVGDEDFVFDNKDQTSCEGHDRAPCVVVINNVSVADAFRMLDNVLTVREDSVYGKAAANCYHSSAAH